MDHRPAIQAIHDRLPGFAPRVALVLGSGAGGLAEGIDDPSPIDFADIPGFPVPTIEGHRGRLVLGRMAGVAVACLQGRVHLYEGHVAAALAVPIRTLRGLGCATLVLANSAGSLRRDLAPGTLMAITDHINWAGFNPLIGPNDDAVGPRFPDMGDAYDRGLRARLRSAAAAEGIALAEGVYLWSSGPSFETPAEIRAFRLLGADAVGMSTVPECLVAVHCGFKVVAVSTITNLAAGLSPRPLSHADTLTQGRAATEKLLRLLTRFLEDFPDD